MAAVAAAAPPRDGRPNILFVFADDWGRCAGAYARVDGPGTMNDIARTPHFDRLAAEGVLFRRAFVSAPHCTPSRSALLSGQHFWRTGRAAILHGAVWDGTNPSFPLRLRDAGYHIGKSYKVWSPGTPKDGPFDSPRHNYEQAGIRFDKFSLSAAELLQAGKSVAAAKEELFLEVRRNFDTFLAERPPGQPFLYWFGAKNVHPSWSRGSGKRLWEIDPDAFRGRVPPYLPDVSVVREDLSDYFGEIQAFDTALGILRTRLEEIGEWENTLVVVSGDNGHPGFPHAKCNLYDAGTGVPLAIRGPGVRGGRVIDDFVTLPDLAPTLLEAGGLRPPAVMTGRSLAPILRARVSGQIDPARDAIFTGRERDEPTARPDFSPYPSRAIRTADYLYIINFRPERWPLGDPHRLDGPNPPTPEEIIDDYRVTLSDVDQGPTKAWLVAVRNDPEWKPVYERAFGKRPREELYHLAADPHQLKNVAADSRHAAARAALERRLLDELRRTGDPRIVDDGKFFENPPLAGRIERPRK